MNHKERIRSTTLEPSQKGLSHSAEIVAQPLSFFVHKVLVQLVSRVRDRVRELQRGLEISGRKSRGVSQSFRGGNIGLLGDHPPGSQQKRM